jgi:hypothetical protein
VTPLLTLLGLASVLAGFVLTALVRAKKLDASWEDRGLWAIFAGSGSSWSGSAWRSPPPSNFRPSRPK